MSRIRPIALCSLAMLAIGTGLVSTASAASPQWFVKEKALEAKATETLSEVTEVAKAFTIKGALFGIECPNIALPKSFIEGEKSGQVVIVAKGCKDLRQPNCVVGTVKTNPLTLTLGGPSK